MTKVNEDYPKKQLSDAKLKQLATEQYQETAVESYDFPTEIIDLPSKGKLYPKDHILSSGTIEMKYMTAKEEDILTNQSYIKQGVVLDKLFKALIMTKVNYNDILLCDKNAIMIAARILGYGKDYEISIPDPESDEMISHTVDLTDLNDKEIDWSLIDEGINAFPLTLPTSKKQIKLKLLSQGEQSKIDAELKGLAKIKKEAGLTTLLKHVIVELDGDDDKSKIRKFVDTNLLAIDSRAIRQFLKTITPEIDMSIEVPVGEAGDTFPSQLDIGLDFFWPDAEL
tara:strand:+ start:320 stop:1168 length:849 start_codon:yes stop_codon:yes gene_type:complete